MLDISVFKYWKQFQCHNIYLPLNPCMQVKNKKEQAFRISNKGLDSVDRYLTLNQKAHQQEKRHLAESDYRREYQGTQESQLWVIEEVVRGKAYRIRHLKEHKYLTLYYSDRLGEYLATFAEKGEASHQNWSFQLGENRRFRIGIKHPSKEERLYLESTERYSLKPKYKTVFQLRPKISDQWKRRYLQFWKLSPFKEQEPQIPVCSREQALKDLTKEQKALLQHFKGKIYTKHSGECYHEVIYQYASSSFPGQMYPFMLVEPLHIADIRIIIDFAKFVKRSIVVRSGGHQYSGLSSGGDQTIVVSLTQFNDLKLNEQGLIEVGPYNKLQDASKFFRDNGISVPHGVCNFVNLGGHAQTGGYGHFTRSFGILIDYVQAFDIVLADGTFRTVRRPEVANTEEEKLNLQIFRGVMGGNAGSFGIVTRFYIKPIKDEDHPQSFSIQRARPFSKQSFKVVLKEFQRWTKLIADKNDSSLDGFDLFLSLTQVKVEIAGVDQITLMNLTGLYSDPNKGVPYAGQFDELFEKFVAGVPEKILEKFINKQSNGRIDLSRLAENYVLKYPVMTSTGREFDLPYRKRGNVTEGPLTDEFINELADQTDSVPKEKELNLVVQMIAGGGQHRIKGERKVNGVTVTSIPLRNLTHTFSFDVFFDGSTVGQQKAEKAQEVMQETVMNHYSKPSGEKLFFWTSYGDLDMRKSEVVKRFYDSQEQYKVLQELKRKIDPHNVFSSLMTVKP